nr:nucleoside-diphosphate kinase [uncultured Odoribacter sp.]
MKNRTFTILKPDAVGGGHTGEILRIIEQAGFRILALKMLYLSRSDAEKFYHIHQGRPFFRNLCLFMTSGPIVAAVLEKENAVADFRKLIGATDPAKASPGTIRKQFAGSKTRNAIHASDSEENASRETAFFFSDREIIESRYELPVPAEKIDE